MYRLEKNVSHGFPMKAMCFGFNFETWINVISIEKAGHVDWVNGEHYSS